MIIKKGLAFKLSLYILTTIIIIFSIILYYNYKISRNLILSDAKKDAQNLTELTVNRIENILNSLEKFPENIVAFLENTSINEKEINSIIRQTVENDNLVYGSCIAFAEHGYNKDSLFHAIYYYKKDGKTQKKSLGNKDYNYFELDWFNSPRELKKAVWTEPYFDKGGGEIMMSTYSVPFYKKTKTGKEFRGVVTIDISLDKLREIVSNISFYESGFAFIISSKGTIVSFPKTDSVQMQKLNPASWNKFYPGLGEIYKKIRTEGKGIFSINEILSDSDIKKWISFTQIPSTNWSLGIIFSEQELLSSIQILTQKLLFIGIFGMFFLFAIIIYISRRNLRPLKKLAEATTLMGKGNFNLDLPMANTNDEIGQLEYSFSQMQSELKAYIKNLKETTTAKEKIENELKIAKEIQMGMLIKDFPPFPQKKEIDVFASLISAKEVGGDFYDFFFLDENKLCFSIGDVSGKGVPASLFMAKTLTLFRAIAKKELKPNKIVEEINNDLCKFNENSMFVTFFMGIIDVSKAEVEFCNAGHNQPYVIKNKGELKKISDFNGLPMGIIPNCEYSFGLIKLSENDKIVLYTDGITEAVDKNTDFYGEKRLENNLLKNVSGKPDDITKDLLNDVISFSTGVEQADDITIMTIEFNRELKEN